MKEDNLNILILLHTLIGKLNSLIKDFEKENLDMMTVVRKLKLSSVTFSDYLFTIKDNISDKPASINEIDYKFT